MREKYRQAHECEPANPYYLAQMLGFEMYAGHSDSSPDIVRVAIRKAIDTCRRHACSGIEMPYACFTAGRLSLLIKDEKADYDALGYYARGLRHFLAGTHCMPGDVLATEIEWLMRLHFGKRIPAPSQRAIDLLRLGQDVASQTRPVTAPGKPLEPPVLIVTGGAASISTTQLAEIQPLLTAALTGFQGTVVSGGTAVGVPGCVGDIAQELSRSNRLRFCLLSYVPERLPYDAPPHESYEAVKCGTGFQPDQILRSWSDILAAGIVPADVTLIGFGGGPLSAVEYRMALGLGASVGVVADSGAAVKSLIDDSLWSRLPNLFPLPADPMTLRAFTLTSELDLAADVAESMAQSFHDRYVARSLSRLPANMRPWPKLADTFKTANVEQARYSVQILEAAGFAVREVESDPVVLNDFTPSEIERMAELEHGRWNIERLRNGWRYSKTRDDLKRLHHYLIPWSELPEDIKTFDREAVRAFPTILAKVRLEVYRLG